MEEWEKQLVELRELSEELTGTERQRQRIKIIGKTISLKNQLDAIDKRLKTPEFTRGDIKKHLQLLTELRLLFRTDEVLSPLNVIKKEMELVTELYNGLAEAYKNILAELN